VGRCRSIPGRLDDSTVSRCHVADTAE